MSFESEVSMEDPIAERTEELTAKDLEQLLSGGRGRSWTVGVVVVVILLYHGDVAE